MCISDPQLDGSTVIDAAKENVGQQTSVYRAFYNFTLNVIIGVGITIDLIEVIDNRVGLDRSKTIYGDSFHMIGTSGSS
ncbi:Putative protein [Zobellia galactanivorans]|uniref:Uncharacterized protein n=1 Tax=Zobellia galactanivorans (strain DSM 12802 / CCUG 47099 / CIP 106680 / NCIMB 13871 / Dsij) TaxID=63186 RepID=G0LCM5_ZOBGA|nr:Putative protein [Zobellia galactanivorans]